MGSPDFGNNDSALGIPMYVLYEDVDSIRDDDSFVYEEYANGYITDESINEIARELGWENPDAIEDAYDISPQQEKELVEYLRDYHDNEILYRAYDIQNMYYDDDVMNIERELEDLNSDLNILRVELVRGYNDGLALQTFCDYIDNHEIRFDYIADNYESEADARKAFDKEYKLVRDFLKHTAAGLGWKPCHDGWVQTYYEDDWK